MFLCLLCEKERVYISSFCDTCQNISKIVKLVGAEESHKILESIVIRDKEKRDNKLEFTKKIDKKDNKIKTRSSIKKELLPDGL